MIRDVLLEALATIDDEKRRDRQTEVVTPNNSDFFKNVIRRHWEGKLQTLNGVDKIRSKSIASEIEAHMASVNTVVDPIDYEIFCIPNLIAHSKHISKEEFPAYLRLMEAMAFGYSSLLGKELASLVMIGMTSKARSISSAQRYHRMLASSIDSKMGRYYSAIEKKKRKIDRLSMHVKKHQSGILRFFRRKRIAIINRRIDNGIKGIEALNAKYEKYSGITRNMSARHGRK